ncbi:MAG TPA: choice-of-anchor X domain-containing protein [Ignavibacteriaceae bacterium]|nr:choice-of-anchor X domain-containing protein [Ignavibacteriaceae bacterium]
MKKYILFFLPLIFWGCQKDYNTIIDPEPIAYQVISISTGETFSYSPSDSLINIGITLKKASDINSVSCDVIGPDNSTLNPSPIVLNEAKTLPDSGFNTYSVSFPMSKYYPSGTYQIKFYVTDINGNTETVSMHSLQYNNGLISPAPVISNLVAPDTVQIGSQNDTLFVSVLAKDSVGLWDIASVFFNSFLPPDGHPSSTNPIILHDDGTFGDKVPGDGIYSTYIILPPVGVTAGTYRFEFQAKSFGGKLSNKIIHNVVVQYGSAPVISSLVAPDTVQIGSQNDTLFVSVLAKDSVGLWDIASVFFNSFIPPDGHASSQNPIPLHDDGTNGDKVANDEIYSSYIILPPQGVTKGTYRFEFQAKSFGDKLSNKIIHNVVIQ